MSTNAEVDAICRDWHRGWVEKKRGEGWVYGSGFDVRKKTDSRLVAWGDLPEEERKEYVLLVYMLYHRRMLCGGERQIS